MSTPTVKELLKTYDRNAKLPYDYTLDKINEDASVNLVMSFYESRETCGDTPEWEKNRDQNEWYLVELLNKRDDMVVIEGFRGEEKVTAAYKHFKGITPLGIAVDDDEVDYYVFSDMGENELKSVFKDTTRIAKRNRAKHDISR